MHFIIVVIYQLILHIGEVCALQLHYFPEYCRFYVKNKPFWGFFTPWDSEFRFLCKLFWRFVDITIQDSIENMIPLWFVWKLFYFEKKQPQIGKFCDFLLFFPVIYPLIFKFLLKKQQLTYMESFIDNGLVLKRL